jgi:hypothetical protein
MTTGVVPASFRDPAGFVWSDNGTLYRQINEAYHAEYDALMSSGLYGVLVSKRLLVAHEEVAVEGPRPGAYKTIKPDRVELVSYPYEWCFGQLRHAALTTIEVQKLALEHGMSLRDASAYNVQFHRGRPVLIDTLSFERYEEGRPWVAYRQFCQHFLAPLALMAYRDVRLGSLLRQYIDGIPLDLAAELLPRRTRWRPSLALHLHAHARMMARYGKREIPQSARRRRMTKQALTGLIGGLERAVRKLKWEPPPSAWRDYDETKDHYSAEATDQKGELVAAIVAETKPRIVWDLGANVGSYSRIAASGGAFVASFDVDPGCVELNYRQTVAAGETSLLPLVCDLTNPSPALGWSHSERMSMSQRGPVDLILALALIHHMAIGNNVPFDRLGAFFAELGDRLVIEFVPKDDPMVQTMLSTRSDIFTDYNEHRFERAFERWFEIERREPLRDSPRTLYLMHKREGS